MWKYSTPEQQGLSSEKLLQIFDTIQKKELQVHSLLIVRNNHLVLESYFYPFSASIRHSLFSCTKSIMSALIGIARDKGYLDSLEHSVLDFFPEYSLKISDTRKQAITLENLLTMTTGLEWDEGKDFPAYIRSSDWVQFTLDMPMVGKPGTVFNYNSGVSHILSAILQQVTGMSTLDFANKYLLGPLGISDFDWVTDPRGIHTGGFGLYLKPVDMAKFGCLYLQEGEWNGRQLISRTWVRESTRKHVDSSGYGYQWWTHEPNSFKASGFGGQQIYVIKDMNMVVVVTNGGGEELPLETFTSVVVSDSALPENVNALKLLEEQIRNAAYSKSVLSALTKTAGKINGRKYRLDKNPIGIESLMFDFNRRNTAAAMLEMVIGEHILTTEIGLDNVYRISDISKVAPPHMKTVHIGLKGFWQDESTFILNYQGIEEPFPQTFHFHFEDDRITLEITAPVMNFQCTVNGSLEQ
jgi:CubicO group peptidase (beta-lactamase class C family)